VSGSGMEHTIMNGTRVRTGRRAAAAGLALLAMGITACIGPSDPVSGKNFRTLPADQVVFDLDTDIKDLGTLRARLHADTAYIWEDSAKTLMFPLDLKLYDENGGETARLTAREGELDSRTDRMVARGDVVLVTTEGSRRILTEELHYDPRAGRIWSDVRTIMFDGTSRLEGEGFRADHQMTDIEVFRSTSENIPMDF
jgi:LPS export ABC transporter protein LptC